MPDEWFYSHGGLKHGPVSAEQLRALVGTGGLAPTDLIWPESIDAVAAIPAEAALSFPSATPAEAASWQPTPAPLPEWVRALTDAGLDVRALEALPLPPAKDWREDVRGVEESAPTPEKNPRLMQ